MSDGDDPCIGRPDDVPLSEFVEELRGKAPTSAGTAPRDEAREKLVADLQAQIVDGEADGSEETDASWGYETGVLLSRAEARIALAALLAAAPRADRETALEEAAREVEDIASGERYGALLLKGRDRNSGLQREGVLRYAARRIRQLAAHAPGWAE